MQIGIISDIHSNLAALKIVIDYFKLHNITLIICAGDMIGYYTRPNEVLDYIRSLNVKSILGNHEIAVITGNTKDFNIIAKQSISYTKRNISKKNLEFLKSLPLRLTLEIDNKKITIVHGSPVNPLEEYIYEEDINDDFIKTYFITPPDILIMGNTHIPFIKRVNQTLVINPGSVGQPRDRDPRTCFVIYDSTINKAKIIRLDYNINEVAKETSEYLSTKLVDRLFHGE